MYLSAHQRRQEKSHFRHKEKLESIILNKKWYGHKTRYPKHTVFTKKGSANNFKQNRVMKFFKYTNRKLFNTDRKLARIKAFRCNC